MQVTIQLPDNRLVKGTLDPTVSRASLKKYLVEKYKLSGAPDDYDLAVLSRDEMKPVNAGVSDGDRIILIERNH